MVPVLIYDDTIDSWTVRSGYDHEWVKQLKHRIPGAARKWDATAKVWIIDGMFIDVVRELCDQFFGGYREHKPEPPPPPPPEVSTNDFYKTFIELCPKDALNALYKSAAKKHHPDVGGDPKKMQELNVCWQKIRLEMNL